MRQLSELPAWAWLVMLCTLCLAAGAAGAMVGRASTPTTQVAEEVGLIRCTPYGAIEMTNLRFDWTFAPHGTVLTLDKLMSRLDGLCSERNKA
jgi:hypothetical protein